MRGWPGMLLLTGIIIAALLIGRLTGGSVSALFDTPIRLAWLAPLALLLQVLDLGPASLSPWLLGASYLLLMVFLVVNLRLGPSTWLMLLGVGMNALVIVANGAMPVSSEAVVASGQGEALIDLVSDADGPKHELLTDRTALPFLADTIGLGPPLRMVVSPGDLVFYAGIGWFLIAAMHRRADRPASTPAPSQA